MDRFSLFASPVGTLKLVAGVGALAAILWEDDDPRRVRLPPAVEAPDDPILIETARQLALYFDGRATAFDVPLAFSGTDFQRKVWSALLTIPYGETRSYREIAAQIGHPTAVRAVGAANGRNPISIIAPCHRVIGATGRLTGFAGGLLVKRHLLELERSLRPAPRGDVSAAQPGVVGSGERRAKHLNTTRIDGDAETIGKRCA